MPARLIGGPELRVRLANVAAVGPEIKAGWSKEAAGRMRQTAPRRSGRGDASIHAGQRGNKSGVFGAWWLIFSDRGTKAHDINARPGGALRFKVAGQTIFAKRVHLRRKAGTHWIARAAQDALRHVGGDAIVKAWSRKSSGRRFSSLRFG